MSEEREVSSAMVTILHSSNPVTGVTPGRRRFFTLIYGWVYYFDHVKLHPTIVRALETAYN